MFRLRLSHRRAFLRRQSIGPQNQSAFLHRWNTDRELRLHGQPLVTARTVCSQSSGPFRRDAIERSVDRVRGGVLEQKTARMSNASSHRLAGDILPRAATKSSILRKPSVKHDVPVDRRRNQRRTKEIVAIRHLSGQAEQRRRSRARPYVVRTCRHMDQARCAGHRRM